MNNELERQFAELINGEWKMLTLHTIHEQDTITTALFWPRPRSNSIWRVIGLFMGVLADFWLVKASKSIDTYQGRIGQNRWRVAWTKVITASIPVVHSL